MSRLKIYGGNFDGRWELQVAAGSWREAVRLLGNMAIGYAKRYGHRWSPGPDDQFLVDEPRVVWKRLSTAYTRREWERRAPCDPPQPKA